MWAIMLQVMSLSKMFFIKNPPLFAHVSHEYKLSLKYTCVVFDEAY